MTEARTSTGFEILLEHGPILTHAEFRLLFALSDRPCGDQFAITVHDAVLRHGFSIPELRQVVKSLDEKRSLIGLIGNSSALERPLKIHWTLP